MSGLKLNREFYSRQDVVKVAKDLLGKKLCSAVDGKLTSGLITEVEAYSGRNDKACHANNGKRTNRTEVMYNQGGTAYVYLIYGIYHLFNVVTNRSDLADAVLIRAIEPINGVPVMVARRKMKEVDKRLTSGPGVLGQALGFDARVHSGIDLLGDLIWLEDIGSRIGESQIVETTRIGVEYAEEDALKPWRFYLKDSNWVSKY